MTISSGKEVSIEYTLRLEDKEVLDSNVGEEPLTYVHGSQQIISGLESRIEGMKVGETRNVEVPPQESYGSLDPDAFREVDKFVVPAGALKVGTHLQGKGRAGQVVQARVAEVKDGSVVLDFNHPLAGKTLFFEVKVLHIREAPAE